METKSPNNQQSSNSISIIINIILAIIVVTMGAIMFIYGNFGSVNKKDLQNDYIKKENITFDDLSYQEKENYISKAYHTGEIEKLKISQTDKKLNTIEKIVYKDKIIEQEPKIIEKVIYKDSKINRSKFNVFRCYGMLPGSYYMTDECKNGLSWFLKENSDAKYFEVIAVIDDKDFKLLKTLENNMDIIKKLNISQKDIDLIKYLSSVGLDKLRVIETLWDVKKILGKDAVIVPVSYSAKSDKNRGTVVRAYK